MERKYYLTTCFNTPPWHSPKETMGKHKSRYILVINKGCYQIYRGFQWRIDWNWGREHSQTKYASPLLYPLQIRHRLMKVYCSFAWDTQQQGH